jgi:hypothetical protein
MKQRMERHNDDPRHLRWSQQPCRASRFLPLPVAAAQRNALLASMLDVVNRRLLARLWWQRPAGAPLVTRRRSITRRSRRTDPLS